MTNYSTEDISGKCSRVKAGKDPRKPGTAFSLVLSWVCKGYQLGYKYKKSLSLFWDKGYDEPGRWLNAGSPGKPNTDKNPDKAFHVNCLLVYSFFYICY